MSRIVMGLALFASSSAFAATVCPTSAQEITATGTYTGDATGATDDFQGTCGSSGGGDVQWEFVAPSAGTYTFATTGTAYDTVLSLFAPDCTTSLVCNDDFGGNLTSQVSRTLTTGERIVINIDGYSANTVTGPFTLDVTYTPPPTCAADTALASQYNITVSGDTSTETNDYTSATCGSGQGSPDYLYSWTAPFAGDFVIDTFGSSYDTALTIRDAGCNELFCNDDDPAGGTLTSSITLTATGGTTYYINVDGYSGTNSGPYLLNIFEAGACADVDGDGICNAQDVCTGDDATGDSDSDGICDDTDFTLNVSAVRPGQTLQLQASNVTPGTNVFFFVSTAGPGVGPCAPAGSPCLDIRQPTRLGQVAANANGNANLTVTVPAGAVPGRNVGFQAAFVAGGGDTTEVEIRQIQP